jgi:hypothetical protein
MSNELVEVGDNSPTVNSFEMVNVESAKAFMDNYQEVCKALLDNSDFQKVRMNGKETAFKKKSAWRKIATAFNISDDVIKEVIIRDDNYQIISATFHVKATAPNGRSGIGVASCSIFDKINKKDKEQPSNFELRNRFNNAENDVIGTAHTRAKSRAISDLVGMGEVSAEELGEMGVIEKPKKVSVKPKTAKPKTKPKAAAKPKTTKPKVTKPQKDDEAIEVQVVNKDSPSKSLKQLIEEDGNIKRVVDELVEEHQTVNRAAIEERLLKWLEAGAIKEDEYKKAKKVMN